MTDLLHKKCMVPCVVVACCYLTAPRHTVCWACLTAKGIMPVATATMTMDTCAEAWQHLQ